MKITEQEAQSFTNKVLIDLYWFGDRLDADEVDIIINEFKW